MTPAEATASELVRAVNKGSGVLTVAAKNVPVSIATKVIEALARQVNECIAALEDVPTLTDWAPGDARRAHARYQRGMRDPWTVAGERSYQRAKKRRYRIEGAA